MASITNRYLPIFLFSLLLSLVSSASSDVNDIFIDKTNFQNFLPRQSYVLKGDAIAQGFVFAFTVLACIDYLVYFVLLVYVMLFAAFESGSILRCLFSILITVIFSCLRLLFLPLILNAIPYSWAPKLPELLVQISFYVCIGSYIVLFNAPLLASLYYSFKFGVRGRKLKSGIVDKSIDAVPNVVIMMPIYNEELEALLRAVQSAIRTDYPADKKHVLLAFDDATESKLYWGLLHKLQILNSDVKSVYGSEFDEYKILNAGLEPTLFPPRLELIVEKVRVTICRFEHEGKSATQGKGYKIINQIYSKTELLNASTLLMYIDSDVILHKNALYNFVATIIANPRLKAVTGYITCRTSENVNIYQYLQDAEYLEGQMFSRNMEALAGSVTCLPGALTVIKLNAMQSIENKYFTDFNKKAPLHFHRYYLGEDRFMTHLLMEDSDTSHTIGLCGASWCKTDAPDSWTKLIKQRRRWYLGALINEAHMLCSLRLWTTMPIPLVLKIFDYASSSLSWLFMVYVISVIKGVVPLWTVAIFFPLLALKFLILDINASFMKRFKVWLSFPILFLVSPFFKLGCTIYSIFTWDVRSWGGPRADFKIKVVSKLDILTDIVKNDNQITVESNEQVQVDQFGTDGTSSRDEKDLEGNTNNVAKGSFPNCVEVLGGGEYYDNLIYSDSPLLTQRSKSPSLHVSSPLVSTLCNTRNNSIDLSNQPPKLPYLFNNSSTSLYGKVNEINNLIDAKYIYGRYQRKITFSTGYDGAATPKNYQSTTNISKFVTSPLSFESNESTSFNNELNDQVERKGSLSSTSTDV